jgi:hypothetical protein
MNINVTNQELVTLDWGDFKSGDFCELVKGYITENTREYDFYLYKIINPRNNEITYSLSVYSAINPYFRDIECVGFESLFVSPENPTGSYCYPIEDTEVGKEIIKELESRFTI